MSLAGSLRAKFRKPQINPFSQTLYTVLKRLTTGWTIRESEFNSRSDREFSLLNSFQTGSGVPPNLLSNGSEALSHGLNRPGSEANHSPPESAEVKKM
jgi:hypothetical protein